MTIQFDSRVSNSNNLKANHSKVRQRGDEEEMLVFAMLMMLSTSLLKPEVVLRTKILVSPMPSIIDKTSSHLNIDLTIVLLIFNQGKICCEDQYITYRHQSSMFFEIVFMKFSQVDTFNILDLLWSNDLLC